MSDSIVRKVANPGPNGAKYLIFCPGCGCCHGWNDTWRFDGNLTNPTVSPSLLVTHLPRYTEELDEDGKPTIIDYSGICHSFITDGKIQFLSDCTHKLAGQTVPLEPF